jgi:transcriptional regulator with XRE-family HTH domain
MHGTAKFVNREFWSPMEEPVLPQPWPPEERFWDRLQRLQRAVGVDNKEIARIAGVAIGTVSAWRHRNPDTDALLRLAAYFKVPPEWLLNGPEPLRAADKRTEPPRDS